MSATTMANRTVAAMAMLFSFILSASSSHAFAPSSTYNIISPIQQTQNNAQQFDTPATQLYMNIPLPTTEGGATPEEVKEAANSVGPPSSFYELQRASVRAAQMAIDDGQTLLEVEFPPLPAAVLDMDDVSAYDVAKANVNLALDFAKSFASTGSKDNIAIMLPDESERNIMLEDLEMESTPYPGVEVTSLRRSEEGDTRIFKPENLLIGLMGRGSGGTTKPIENTKMYIIVGASAQELPDVELYEQIKDDKDENGNCPTIVFYNLKLDVLRGDLGAPAFPGKDFQDRFLSRK